MTWLAWGWRVPGASAAAFINALTLSSKRRRIAWVPNIQLRVDHCLNVTYVQSDIDRIAYAFKSGC